MNQPLLQKIVRIWQLPSLAAVAVRVLELARQRERNCAKAGFFTVAA